MPQTIHIFRPGRHTAMQGTTIDFGESDLIATAKAYDPARHEAPLVISHPAADAPAWGWVGSLTADTHGLFAAPRQLDASFAEMVRAGRFKKISASFYAPDNPHNPVPGVWYLRHGGFLGAQPPAVKGLAPVNFAEGDTDEGCVSFDFAESPGLLRWLADLFRGLREYVVEKDGTEMADRAIPSYAVSGLQEMAAASAAQAAEIPAFAENLTLPKEKSMQKQETPPAENIDFAEDGGKTTSMSPAAFMAAFLERLPKQVDFSEVAPGGEEALDTSSNDIAQRALAEAKAPSGDMTTTCFPGTIAVESGGIFSVTNWDSK